MKSAIHFTARVRKQGAIGLPFFHDFHIPFNYNTGDEQDHKSAMVDEIRRMGYEVMGGIKVKV